MKIGSLFSGYGGLDLGVQAVLGGDIVFHAEFDDAPARILEHHWPSVPNFGDVTKVDWAAVRESLSDVPFEVIWDLILTLGFPCQDVSLAGLRRGLKDGTRSGLWSEAARAIDVLRPGLVVIENVRGLLSAEADRGMESDPWTMGDGNSRPTLRALGAVLGDLADLGYNARWCGVRAADAGAPHGRFRIFILAYPRGEAFGFGTGLRPRKSARFGRGRSHDDGLQDTATDTSHHDSDWRAAARSGSRWPAEAGSTAPAWGTYEPAIRRWESVTGRVAPTPTRRDGRNDAQRLNPVFVEWMMGLPEGWLTAPEIGLTRNQQLKALGNGVVPQQAALAVRSLLDAIEVAA